jgi:hypothetical protein
MSYANFTAEQLAQEARADMQQSEILRFWLQSARGPCDNSNVSRVPTTGRNSDRACRDYGAGLKYSLDEGSIQQSACAGARQPARSCAI